MKIFITENNKWPRCSWEGVWRSYFMSAPPVNRTLGTVAEIIDPWLADKVNSIIGMSYRHARLYMTGGPVRQPYAGVDFIPRSGSMDSATGFDSWPGSRGGCLLSIAMRLIKRSSVQLVHASPVEESHYQKKYLPTTQINKKYKN